ncbi:hypothetical protein [Amycolatopsis sacchari]|uniref:hypothetical protein n=1 Tax=Amycolatopsis sacchari TaxID=115433 RepID=UPI003EB70847
MTEALEGLGDDVLAGPFLWLPSAIATPPISRLVGSSSAAPDPGRARVALPPRRGQDFPAVRRVRCSAADERRGGAGRDVGEVIAHVAAEMGISRQCASKGINRDRTWSA